MKLTYGILIDAIEKNGYEQDFNVYVHVDKNDKPIAACALGQGYLNLREEYNLGGIDDEDANYFFEAEYWSQDGNGNLRPRWGLNRAFTSTVIELNDVQHWPIQRIVDELRVQYRDILDTEIMQLEYDGPGDAYYEANN